MLPNQIPTPNLNAIQPEPVPAPNAPATTQAKLEDDFFAQDKRQREHKREQRVKDVINALIICIIVVSGILLSCAIIIRVLHMVLPPSATWLSEKQIDLLDSLAKYAGSGALGVSLTKYLSKNIGQEP